MSYVPHGLVVELINPALKCLTHGSESTRRRERFKLQTVDENGLQCTHRWNKLGLTVLDDFAIVEVFVYHTFRRPVERVTQKPGWVLRKRTNAKIDLTQL